MPFPTATITQGSGLTINTLPNAGQASMANSLSVAIASDQGAVPVTSLNSGAITNPTSVLTRPASAVSAAVTATSATPCVFTWVGNPLVNGQTVILGGTAVPTGFTAGATYYVVGVSGNTFQLAATFGGAAIASTSTGTAVTATLVYVPGTLFASSLTTPVVPSFAIATTAGGVIIPRIRIVTNAAGVLANGNYAATPFPTPTNTWGGAVVLVHLWSAAPTYNGGDGQPYAPLTGAAGCLASYQVALEQFGDGAAGSGGLIGASQMAEKLASGTAIFWDIQASTQANPFAGQTWTITPELLN